MTAESLAGSSSREPDSNPLLVVAGFEGRNRLKVTGVIMVLFVLYGAMYFWIGPQMVAEEAVTELLNAMPDVVNELFGFESLASMEGLIASEFYTFGWIVGFGGYLAYSAAGSVASDLRDERMDTLLAAPIPRWSVLFGKFASLLVPILVLNVAVPLLLYVGSIAVNDPFSVADLAALHALSIPYLLFWSAVGLSSGVVIRDGRKAGRVVLGLVFFGWIFEAVISTTEYDWLGGVSPMRYFDPPAVLIHGSYDVSGAVLLSAGTVVLLVVSHLWFLRADL